MKTKHIIIIAILSMLLGLGIGVWRISSVQNSKAFAKYGSWRGTTDLPLNRNDLVTTQVTLFALFALPSYEAVYLFAAADDHDQRLNGDGTYYLQGNIHDIKAAYWSITAYGNDLYLIPNERSRYSFNSNNLVTDSAGNYKITVSSEKCEGNWLPVHREKRAARSWMPFSKDNNFQLVLRIYQGEHNFMEHLDTIHLPVISKKVAS